MKLARTEQETLLPNFDYRKEVNYGSGLPEISAGIRQPFLWRSSIEMSGIRTERGWLMKRCWSLAIALAHWPIFSNLRLNSIIITIKLLIESQKPDKESEHILSPNLLHQLIHSIIEGIPIPIESKSKPNFLQPVIDIRLAYILIIAPSVAQPQLSVDKVVAGPQPVAQGDRLGTEVVVEVVRVVHVLQVHQDPAVLFWGCWEVVLVQGRLESQRVLETLVSLEWGLLATPVDLEHQVLIPFVECQEGGHPLCNPDRLPVDIVLLPHPIHVVRNQNVMSLDVHLHFPEQQEVVGNQDGPSCTQDLDVEVVRLRVFGVHLPSESSQEQPPQWRGLSPANLPVNPVPKPAHPNIIIVLNQPIKIIYGCPCPQWESDFSSSSPYCLYYYYSIHPSNTCYLHYYYYSPHSPHHQGYSPSPYYCYGYGSVSVALDCYHVSNRGRLRRRLSLSSTGSRLGRRDVRCSRFWVSCSAGCGERGRSGNCRSL